MKIEWGVAQVLAQQVLVIILLMCVGIFIRKKKMVSLEAARMFSNVVLVIVIPVLLVHTFQQQEMREGMLRQVGLGLLLAAVFHLLAIGVTRLVYPKLNDKTAVERLMVVCSNCGFMGIPLITAAVGKEGLIYAALYICIFNIYNWTHAAMILTRSRNISLKKALLTPGTLSAIAGLAIFLLGIKFPYAINETMSMISAMNTPLPTMIMGMFVADISVKAALTDKRVYGTVFLRLLGLPLLFMALCWAVQVHRWFPGSDMVAFVLTICCSCSGAISVILLPARFGGGDEGHGGAMVMVSNLFSILTIPLVATVANAIFMI